MIVGLCFALMFFFVPETFWDRTPRPRSKLRRPNISAIFSFHPTSEKDNVASSSNSGHPGTKSSVTDDVMSRGEAGAAFHEERRIHMPSQHVDFISQPETDNKLDKERQQTLLSEQSGQDSNGMTNRAVSSVGSLDKISATKDSSHLQASPEGSLCR